MSLSLLAHLVVLLLAFWGASALVRRFIVGTGESPVASGGIVFFYRSAAKQR